MREEIGCRTGGNGVINVRTRMVLHFGYAWLIPRLLVQAGCHLPIVKKTFPLRDPQIEGAWDTFPRRDVGKTTPSMFQTLVQERSRILLSLGEQVCKCGTAQIKKRCAAVSRQHELTPSNDR